MDVARRPRAVSLPRVPLTLGAVYGDGWELYRLLMRRSILTAFVVYAVVDGVAELSGLPRSTAARVEFELLSFVLTLSDPVVVHEGRPPERIPALIREAGRRFWSPIGASILYGLGVFFGLLRAVAWRSVTGAVHRTRPDSPVLPADGAGAAGCPRRRLALDVRLGRPYGRGLMPRRRLPSGSSGGSPARQASTAWRHSRTISAPTRSAASA